MTQVGPDTIQIGQHGMAPEDAHPAPGPDDPLHHLAVMLGMMGGDKYTKTPEPGFGVTDLQAATTTPDAAVAPTQSETPKGDASVLTAANKYMGVPYHYGANDPKYGLDCSSFVQRSFADIGISLPRVTYDQVKQGVGITRDQLKPGDLIFLWGDGNRKDGHVGIYAGGNIMINEPHTGASVRYDNINWDRVTNLRRVG